MTATMTGPTASLALQTYDTRLDMSYTSRKHLSLRLFLNEMKNKERGDEIPLHVYPITLQKDRQTAFLSSLLELV